MNANQLVARWSWRTAVGVAAILLAGYAGTSMGQEVKLTLSGEGPETGLAVKFKLFLQKNAFERAWIHRLTIHHHGDREAPLLGQS